LLPTTRAPLRSTATLARTKLTALRRAISSQVQKLGLRLRVHFVDTSSNGTFVNGVRVERDTEQTLVEGDSIFLVTHDPRVLNQPRLPSPSLAPVPLLRRS